ncbi:hypothetical protein [uncultured Methylobacterium sp.]|uniref:hypothetical protein n=1 Tax=uncultured Methylobacterium sp. TaxID=157278 RepID=UPI0025956789|nr:hypothetical protein [uncultured Methylobacterium sp.]
MADNAENTDPELQDIEELRRLERRGGAGGSPSRGPKLARVIGFLAALILASLAVVWFVTR